MNLSKDELRVFIKLLETLDSEHPQSDNIEVNIKSIAKDSWWQFSLIQPVGYDKESGHTVSISKVDLRSYILLLDDLESILTASKRAYIESISSWQKNTSPIQRGNDAKLYFDRETYRSIQAKKRIAEANRLAEEEKERREREAREEALRPKIKNIHFLQGKSKDVFAIEFLLTNPSPKRILVHQAHVMYYNGILIQHFTPPPVFQYELETLFTSSTKDNTLLIEGTAREPKDEWGRPITGGVTIVPGEAISVGLSFPLYLQIAPNEQGLVRLIFKHPRLLHNINAEESESVHIPTEFQSWTDRKGELSIILEGDWDKPAEAGVRNNSLLRFLIEQMATPVNSESAKPQLKPFQMFHATRKAMSPKMPDEDVISILFLAADPTDASRLRLGEEFRELQEKLKIAKFRDQFVLELPQLSVRPSDISQALLDIEPQIVHFSGHGMADGALCFETLTGQIQLVQPDALAALFEQFSRQINCVLLNACYSEIQAKAIAEHIEYVIGMHQEVGDKAAIAFAIGFYQALGAGKTIEDAFKLGCVQIRLQSIPEHLTPVLIKKGN